MEKNPPAPASKIVSAVGVASVAITPGGKSLSRQIEAAMSQAVLGCADEGITDPNEIRERMMEARQKVRDDLKEWR